MDCNEFLSYVYTETKPYTDAGSIYYYLHLPEGQFFIYHQKSRLFRAFENMILNATEHTPPEGSLTITAEYSDKEAVITFTDTGEGISPEDMPHIFDYKFSTKNSPGTIKAMSEKGRYTAFTITLPLVKQEN